MLVFKKAELKDKADIDELLRCSPCESMEYNFTLLFIWQNQYGIEFAIEDDMLYIRSGRSKKAYLFPCGKKDVKSAVDKLLDYCHDGLIFYALNDRQKVFLESEYPSKFIFTENRDLSDYVYLAENLANLKGKKLSSKRNHINKFETENPDWQYEELSDDNLEEVKRMHEKWCKTQDFSERKGLKEETEAVKIALKNYKELELFGGLIRIGGEVVAFSVGDKLNANTVLVNIEKAFSDINGAYTIINREFVRHHCDGFTYVNREDDAADEGLRRAKLSYQPYEVIKKYNAKEVK